MGDLVPNLWDQLDFTTDYKRQITSSPLIDVKQECFDIDIKQEYNPFVTSVTPITAPIKREKSRPPPLNLDFIGSFDSESFSSQDETSSPEAEQEVPNYISRWIKRKAWWKNAFKFFGSPKLNS